MALKLSFRKELLRMSWVSKIIFLNGCGSSGKSSIARGIQQLSLDHWLTFGVDTFIEMTPEDKQEAYFKMIPGENERGPTMRVEPESAGHTLFGVMPRFAALLADRGHHLIIDEVLFDEGSLKAYVESLKDHTVYYIGVFCDLKVMQEREILRRDRCIGLSNDQIDRVHQGLLGSYDFKVDTTNISLLEAARLIFKFMDDTPMPQAFKGMRNDDKPI